MPDEPPIGSVRHPPGEIDLAEGRERRTLTVTNRSARPVRVSSHFPFWLVNRRMELDRDRARGFRLDIPAGSSVRWGPGETREVDLVAYAESGG